MSVTKKYQQHWWLEDEYPFAMALFSGAMLVSGSLSAILNGGFLESNTVDG